MEKQWSTRRSTSHIERRTGKRAPALFGGPASAGSGEADFTGATFERLGVGSDDEEADTYATNEGTFTLDAGSSGLLIIGQSDRVGQTVEVSVCGIDDEDIHTVILGDANAPVPSLNCS